MKSDWYMESTTNMKSNWLHKNKCYYILFIHSIINIKNIIIHPIKKYLLNIHTFCSYNNMKNYTISKNKFKERNEKTNVS
jgi:hypothetical protein